MAKPFGMTLARSGMGYVGAWDRGAVEVTVDHMRRRSGELHGELVVSAGSVPVGGGLLHRASFNLSSTTARERLAKSLTDRARTGDTIPWRDYLEEFCAAVLEADRAGAPIMGVGRLPDAEDRGYLVDPLIPSGKTTIVFAAGGTGKSYLAVLVAVAVASGSDVMGWRVQPGKVLYLDWETDEWEVDERIKRVAAGMAIDPPEILYRSCAGSLEDIAERVAEVVTREGVKLVVVDSVGMASGASREGGSAEESAIRLFGALRYLGTTVLAIDHVTGEDSKSDKAISKPYGSIYKVNLARSVWELRGSPSDTGTSHMALFHRKVNRGRLLPPIGLAVRHNEDGVVFAREEVEDEGLVMAMTNSARIARVLRTGSLRVAEIADETGISEPVVRVTLSRGKGGLFDRLPDGSWGLVEHGRT